MGNYQKRFECSKFWSGIMKFLILNTLLLLNLFGNMAVYANLNSCKYGNKGEYGDDTPISLIEGKELGIIMPKQTLENRLKKYDDNGYIIQGYCKEQMKYCQKIDIAKYINLSNDIKIVRKFYVGVEGEAIDFFSYTFNKSYKQPQYPDKHTITETEKKDVIKLLSVVVDDTEKANQLFDELYQGYRKNLEEDCQYSIHRIAYAVEYDGKLFELSGYVYGERSAVSQITTLRIK